MTAKENAYETYAEELLLQHMTLHGSSSMVDKDPVSSAQSKASKATDDVATALAKQMEVKIADRGDKLRIKTTNQ